MTRACEQCPIRKTCPIKGNPVSIDRNRDPSQSFFDCDVYDRDLKSGRSRAFDTLNIDKTDFHIVSVDKKPDTLAHKYFPTEIVKTPPDKIERWVDEHGNILLGLGEGVLYVTGQRLDDRRGK